MSLDLRKISHKDIVAQKLADQQMRENLSSAMHTLQNNRAGIIGSKFNDWEGLREKAKAVKNRSLRHLKERVEVFEKNARANGIQVHFASTDKDACEVIYQIIKQKQATKILKGKSMASEEIGLNHYLKERNVIAEEADLGELIIQLNNEPPVHIVTPAIHKNRHEVGEIFHDKLGAPLESDIEKLNAIARKHLRNDFKELKVGLSGVNFAIANEGAIWLIENEGNGRMCTTSPDVHIAICGIEKIVETFEDAATLVHVLTPSATGALIPTYNNIITGPRQPGDKDGPREVHVVIFDHNRSSMLQNPDYYEALRCIRCGSCMNHCPVYVQIGGHSYRTTYPGPIGEVISPNLFGIDKTGDILSFCSLCTRCSEVCPVKIPLATLIRRLRANKVGEGSHPPVGAQNLKIPFKEKTAFKIFRIAASNPGIWQFALATAPAMNGLMLGMNLQQVLPVVKDWAHFHKMPALARGNIYSKIKKIEGVRYE